MSSLRLPRTPILLRRIAAFNVLLNDFRNGEVDVTIKLAQARARTGCAESSLPHFITRGTVIRSVGADGA